MNNHYVKTLLIALFWSVSSSLYSQNIAINSSGRQADPSALLDMSSNVAGMLPPRMTDAQMNSITHPAQGLMVFDSTTHCFMVYSGSSWQSMFCACTSAPGTPGSITGSATVCAGASGVTYSIVALVGANSYSWNIPSGASVTAGQGTTRITVTFGSASGNISVTATNNCGTSAANTLPVMVDTLPTITGQPASPAAVCAGTGSPSFTVTAAGTGLTYQWQEYISSWNNITNGGVYSGATTPTLTITNPPVGMNGNKYQCVVSGTCSPSVTSNGLATLTVNPTPTITSVTPGSRTGAGTVTLGATASSGTINWWANPTGGSSLATGTSYITPSLCTASTTTYYVDATANGCTTATRTSVTATVSKVFQVDHACSLTTGLVSYWEMEGNSNDFYSSNNGTDNAMTYGAQYGKVNQGANFNGSSSVITIGNPGNLQITGSISIAFWMKAASTNPGGTYGIICKTDDGSNRSFGTWVNGSGFNAQFSCNGSGGNIYWGGCSVPDVNYHFWVVTFNPNGPVLNIYIDGSPVSYNLLASAWCGNSLYNTSVAFTMGERSGNQWPFNGDLDEVGVWSKILSQQEITDLYNGGAGQTMQ